MGHHNNLLACVNGVTRRIFIVSDRAWQL